MSKEVVTMAGTDAMRERIAAHPWPRGGVEVIRANRGDTLYGRRTGGQVARLRPTGENDDVQILWWRGAGWATPGDFGPLIMPLNEACKRQRENPSQERLAEGAGCGGVKLRRPRILRLWGQQPDEWDEACGSICAGSLLLPC